MRDCRDEGVHRFSRRELLRGAAGLGLAAAVGGGGGLLAACGSGGGEDDLRAGDAEGDGPLETTSIRLHSVPNVSCIAAEYMAEPFLYEEGFTDVQYPSFPPAKVVEAYTNGDFDFGVGYAAVLINLVEQGAPVVMLGGVHVGCWQVFGTGDIKSMRDFKGKKVSLVSPEFTDGIFLAMTLSSVGLDLQKDVTMVSYPPSENARILSSGEVDAVVAFPPISKDLRTRGIGTVVLNSLTDPPWSSYYCCSASANSTWMEKHPVAAKRALRAVLKGADVVARDPERAGRLMVDRGYATDFDVTCQILREIPYDIWREFDPVDSLRFYALQLKEAGIINSTPEQIIERGSDFRYLAELKRELKEA
ncbi:MAG: ABC transporter substrate-binding protein [Acidimicrobiia bacterium]